jgi:hypothetical protein
MSHEPRTSSHGKRQLIACEVFKDEFEAVSPPDVVCTYLPQGLHRTPGKMPAAVQEVVDGLAADTELVILGYGLCSNGVVGVTARTAPIVMPKVHDCIALLLGSRERYEEEVHACAGSYYITPGWAKYGITSLTCYKTEYLPKYGEEDARYIARELLKNYKRVVFINHGVGDIELGRAHTQEFARIFELESGETAGSLDYLRRLVLGPWDTDDFLSIEPGASISPSPFLGLHALNLP